MMKRWWGGAASALLLAAGLLCAQNASAQEDCDNAIDDDADGLVDLNDTTDCSCTVVVDEVNGIGSYIANPSFEEYWFQPWSFSQLALAMQWEQATQGTSDYFNTGGYMVPGVPLPLPDGDGLAGFISMHAPYENDTGSFVYNEYLGANTLQPLLAGTTYSIQAYIAGTLLNGNGLSARPITYGPLDITLFGLADTANFPVGSGLDFGCPVPNGWIELGHASYQAENAWSTITITITPSVDIHAVMIGGPCNVPADHVQVQDGDSTFTPYYFMDKLVLNETALFDYAITATGDMCAGNVVLTAVVDGSATGFQWYRNGVALVGNTAATLAVSALALGAGIYQCRVQRAGGCVLLTYTIPDVGASLIATATPGTIAPGEEVLLTVAGSDSVLWSPAAGLTCPDCDTLFASPVESTTYCVIARDGIGCDTACVRVGVVIPCNEVFVPSAFSPNGSGKNDLHCVYGGTCVTTMVFSIYDRWGNKVFETFDQKTCWDGLHNGEPLNPGVFVYHLSATRTNGETVERQGNVTLVR